MRNILFRAKRTDSGEWVEGWYCKYPFGRWPLRHAIIPSDDAEDGYHTFVEINPDTVCEWTGLTDKNGEKIFDGDVVDGADFQADDGYAKIRWDDDAARFVILGYGLVCDFDNYYGHELEVIGNIYDNPDLIEW